MGAISSEQAMAEGQAQADAYWETIPDDVTVSDAVAMPFGGERNLVLRKALGIKFPGKTKVQVSKQDWVQIVTVDARKARWHERQLVDGLGDEWRVGSKRTSDGWFVGARRA